MEGRPGKLKHLRHLSVERPRNAQFAIISFQWLESDNIAAGGSAEKKLKRSCSDVVLKRHCM